MGLKTIHHHLFFTKEPMRPKLFFLLLPLTLLLLLQSPLVQAGQDKDVHFSDLIITTSKSHLLLFGTLNNGITEEMRQGLHNGIPIEFTFQVALHKTEKNWPDLQLVAIEFQHILSYDTLQETYRLETTERKQKTSSFSQLNDALKALNEINGLLVIELSQLIPDSSYQLQLKAELYEKTLPMKLHYIVPFVSWWDIKTDWHTIEFTY